MGLGTALLETGSQKTDNADGAFLVIGLVQGLVLRWSLSGRAFNLAEDGRRLLSILLAGFSAPGQAEKPFSPGRQARPMDRTAAPADQET